MNEIHLKYFVFCGLDKSNLYFVIEIAIIRSYYDCKGPLVKRRKHRSKKINDWNYYY